MSIAKWMNARRFSRKTVKPKVEELYDQEQLREAVENPAAVLTLKFGLHQDKELSLAPPEYRRWLLEHSDSFSPLGCSILKEYAESA
jgi:hypothetical protein